MKRVDCMKLGLALALASGVVAAGATGLSGRAQQPTTQIPSDPLKFGAFVVRFDPGGTFTLQGQGWPSLSGNWKLNGAAI